MDIQRMVDERIEELRNETIRINRHEASSRRRDFDKAPSIQPRESRHQREHSRNSRGDLSGITAMIESSLTEVAERVLAISDQVAGDYVRMEKDILDSRLALLQSAESVLDIAIILRRKARAMISSVPAEDVESHGYGRGNRRFHVRPLADEDFRVSDEERYRHIREGRVSMHDHGVASLFRRT